MSPTDRILAALRERACDPLQSGDSWSARCPAHEDDRASLSVKEGDEGRGLVHCHAGCSPDAVCSALGLQLSDLMPGGPSRTPTSTKPLDFRGKQGIRRQTATESPGKRFTTAHEAVTELERRHGPRSACWTYRDAQGEPVGVVVRWDLAGGGKDIRPVSRHPDGWSISGMPDPRPLYGLPDLADAETVYVVEGEKAADAARSLGLIATTSAHGAQSPGKTDWTPLAGKTVVILPDNDTAGRGYADAVVAILGRLAPPSVVKVVELPGLPDKGDIADWIEAQIDWVDLGSLRKKVESLAAAAQPIERNTADTPDRFRPFPVDALPEPLRGFVIAGSKAIGCDPSFVALPLLAALAGAIGNSRRVQLKRGWTAPPTLWVAVVGESGTAKTPAFKLVMRPIRERQRKALERHAEAMQEYEANLTRYEKAFTEWKREKKSPGDPPKKPTPPEAERLIVSDTTIEGLAALLLANPRGLLLARDELAGWALSFDRYAGGKGGGDEAHWLSMHNGETIIVDRKTGVPRTIYIPQASICICGGIQPAILKRVLSTEHRESGLAARLLLTWPPRLVKRWTEADIDPAAEEEIAKLVDRLYELQPTVSDQGEMRPVLVGLTDDAKAIWKLYYNDNANEQVDLAGDLAAAWSKLEEYAARLALVVHFARWAAGDPTLISEDSVDAVSMATGIRLATWFKGEARRVYAMLGETEDDRDRRRLAEWIGRKGGEVTVRAVQGGYRSLREAGEAEAALEGLVKAGFGCWRNSPTTAKGGRPSRVFTLSTASTVNETPTTTEKNGGFVDVDIDDTPDKPGSVDEWGEL